MLVPLGGLLLDSDVFPLTVAWCVVFLCADKIGPTMAVLRLDVQRNIEVSKQDLLSFSSPGLILLGVTDSPSWLLIR
jgi:hypothetical protein